jgi:hypothetical protein
MHKHALAVTLSALCLAACGGGQNQNPAPKPTGSKVTDTAKSSQSSLKSQKPASAMKTSTPPKPIPAAKTAGGTTVTPPDPTAGGKEVETWAFTNVDLDGDGVGESGIIAADETTMLVWFTGTAKDKEGNTVSFEALIWYQETAVGFIFDFGSTGALACGADASGTGGCVACNATQCSEVGLSSDGM